MSSYRFVSLALLPTVAGALTQSAFATVLYTGNQCDRGSHRRRDQHQHGLTTIND
jgi:hypothetical protein